MLPPVPEMVPATVVLVLFAPTARDFAPKFTLPAEPLANDPMVNPLAVIPLMSKVELAEAAEILTAVLEDKAPDPVRAKVPPRTVVAPV